MTKWGESQAKSEAAKPDADRAQRQRKMHFVKRFPLRLRSGCALRLRQSGVGFSVLITKGSPTAGPPWAVIRHRIDAKIARRRGLRLYRACGARPVASCLGAQLLSCLVASQIVYAAWTFVPYARLAYQLPRPCGVRSMKFQIGVSKSMPRSLISGDIHGCAV